MKRWVFIILFFVPIIINAQEIRYDTIKVSANDERNIHIRQNKYNISEQTTESTGYKNEWSTSKSNAQIQFDRSKLRFGANLGLSISNNYTNLGFGPQVGYQFNDYFMTGTGIKYYHTKAKYSAYEVKNNLVGFNIFGYLYPVRFITIFMQPEINYTHRSYKYHGGDERISKGLAPSLIAGVGLKMGYTHLTINYDLIQHAYSPHPSNLYMGVSAFF